MTMTDPKVVRVNHGKVFSDRDWFTFHCPHCNEQITLPTSGETCEHCHKKINWL